jgi:hypothetical protein
MRSFILFVGFAALSSACSASSPADIVPDLVLPTPDSGACTGTATPCFSLSTDTCSSMIGCEVTPGTCTGDPLPCPDLFIESDCAAEPNCLWNATEQTCAGMVEACEEQTTESVCGTFMGCVWTTPTCSGVPQDCTKYDAQTCASVSGCMLSK